MAGNGENELATRLKNLLRSGDFDALQRESERLMAMGLKDPDAWSHAAGCMIEAGAGKTDVSLVEKGLELLRHLKDNRALLTASGMATVEYNMANGFLAKARILSEQNHQNAGDEALTEAKLLLQSVLLSRDDVPSNLLPDVMTNYANLLDDLGRSFEAIDFYVDCIRDNPTHAMAVGNCGMAIKRIAPLSQHHFLRNLHEGRRLLSEACAQEEAVLSVGGPHAVQCFQEQLRWLEQYIEEKLDGGQGFLEQWSVHRHEVHGEPEAPAWLSEINTDRLLLTLNQNPLDSIDECVDDVFFDELFTRKTEDVIQRITGLLNGLNILKEDYVTARYLYYHRRDSTTDLEGRGAVTLYGDGLDYAEFGLDYGLLKGSFRLAADCLDKIAVFLNDYFDLGNRPRQVDFRKVWFQKCNPDKPLHPTVAQKLEKNIFLRALMDLQSDWILQEFPGRLKDSRDAATHRRLVVYWLPPDQTEVSDAQVGWGTQDFERVTFFLLRMVKAAILYLVSMIAVEESERTQPDGVVVPLEFGFNPVFDSSIDGFEEDAE